MTDHRGCRWLFDLDGTLIDSISGEILRPYVRELLTALHASGATVLIWSAGGAGYIRRRAAHAGFAELVDGAFTKRRRSCDGKWQLPQELSAHPPCVLVDDQPEEIPRVGEVIGVRPFVGSNPRDRAFADLLEHQCSRLHPRQEIS